MALHVFALVAAFGLPSCGISGMGSHGTPMKLIKLSLRDFRGFRSFDLDLAPDVTALVGVNGAGKTSILDALARLL